MDCNHNPRFSIAVGKLKDIFTFNLKAIETCPHRTELCSKCCYARGGNYSNPDVQKMYKDNLEASKCDCFVERMVAIIITLSMYVMINKHKVIRIHTSGDFYSTKYFLKWIEITKLFPQYKFYVYTRNWIIDFNLCPPNFKMFNSTDPTTKKINPTAKHFTRILPQHKDSVDVPHLTEYDGGFVCTSNRCDLCKFCWEKDGDVYFPQKFKTHAVFEKLKFEEMELLPLIT